MKKDRSNIWRNELLKSLTNELPTRSLTVIVAGGTHGLVIRDGTKGRPPMDLTPDQAGLWCLQLLTMDRFDHGLCSWEAVSDG